MGGGKQIEESGERFRGKGERREEGDKK